VPHVLRAFLAATAAVAAISTAVAASTSTGRVDRRPFRGD